MPATPARVWAAMQDARAKGKGSYDLCLVHRAWHGAWCWRRVTRMLDRARSRSVYADLTGVGERSHLLTPEIDFSTHISDVVNVMKWERRRSDRAGRTFLRRSGCLACRETKERCNRRVVLLDAFYPDNGQSLADQATKMTRDAIEAAVQKRDTVLAPRPAAMFKVNEKDCAWVDALCVPHPIRCFTERSSPHRCVDRIARETYIRAAAIRTKASTRRAPRRRRNGWRIHDVACGHERHG